MTEPETTLIKSETPRREWLVRCSDNDLKLAVCAVCVSSGEVEIYSPDEDRIVLDRSQIADFHAALHEAIDLAETDLRRKELERRRATA